MSQDFINSLEGLLKQINIPDTNVVKQATSKLSKEYYPNPDSLPAMIHILQNHPDDAIKQLAAIESKKLVIRHWDSTSAEVRNQIKSTILESTMSESNKQVSHLSSRLVAFIGEKELENDNSWPELLPKLVSDASNNQNVSQKVTSIYILYTLLETYSQQLASHTQEFLQLFSSTINDQQSLEARVYSVLSIIILGSFLEENNDVNGESAQIFRGLIEPMVSVLREVISTDDMHLAKLVIIAFNDYAYFESKLAGDNHMLLIKVFTEIALTKDIDEDYVIMALQFLIRIIPVKKSKIMSNKLGPDLVLTGLQIASGEIDVEEELDTENEENENEESSPVSLALRFLANLSNELPPSHVINPVLAQLNNLINSSNQFERRAGLLSVGVISAGSPDYVSTYLPKLIPVLLQGLKDPEPIVKVAALKTVTELTGDLQNALASYHAVLLPLIIEIIDSATHVALYKYGTYALDGIIEYIDHNDIPQYLEPLMRKLLHMFELSNNSPSLKTAVVSAIGSTAFAAGKSFIPYFKDCLKFLEPLIQMNQPVDQLSEEEIELKASTFENISTMARAVGAVSFSEFAEPLLDSAYLCIESDSARLRESGFAFLSNLAKIYGEDLKGVLPKFIPAIIKCLQQNEMQGFDELEGNGEDEEEEAFYDDFDANDLDGKFGIHTGITMEKDIAAIALGELIVGTKKHFFEYIQEVTKVLLDQIETSISIGSIAMTTLWKIAISLYENGDIKTDFPIGAVSGSYVSEQVLQYVRMIREKSLDTLVEEYDITEVHNILTNFQQALKKMGPIAIMDNGDSSSLELLCFELMKLLKNEHIAQSELDDSSEVAQNKDGEVTEAELVEFDNCLDVLIELSKSLGPDFNRIYESFGKVLYKALNSSSGNKRSMILGGIGEMALGLGKSNQYFSEMLSVFVESLTKDKYLSSKSNSAYGIGIIIYYSGEDYTQGYSNILALLSKLLSKANKEKTNADEDDEETQEVVDRSYSNACGCVARMALKSINHIPLDQILPVLLSHLPLKEGFEENTPIFELIIELYQTKFDVIDTYTEQIVKIFQEVFQKEHEVEQLERESTLGREHDIDSMKQFQEAGLKDKVVELLKFIESKHPGTVTPVLGSIIN